MSKGRVPWGVISTAKIETSRGDPAIQASSSDELVAVGMNLADVSRLDSPSPDDAAQNMLVIQGLYRCAWGRGRV